MNVTAHLFRSSEEKQALMTSYDEGLVAGVFEDYNELVLQFGYVTLFAVYFPFVSLLALVSQCQSELIL